MPGEPFIVEFHVPYYKFEQALSGAPDGYELDSWSAEPFRDTSWTATYTVVYKKRVEPAGWVGGPR